MPFSNGAVLAMLALIETTSVAGLVWAARNMPTSKDVEDRFDQHKEVHHNEIET